MKVKFRYNAWPQLCKMDIGFLKEFSNLHSAKLVDTDADIVFYENREIDNNSDADACKIFITGENTFPNDASQFELVIGFKSRSPNSYILPLWTFSLDWEPNSTSDWSVSRLLTSRNVSIDNNRQRFCGFVSCRPRQYRVNFVLKLSTYKSVTCAGKVLNNFPLVGNSEDDKKEFLQTCKFGIAFENDDYEDMEGYVTEKIIDIFVAGAIPIYCGDPNIGNVFNPKAFLNRAHYNSDEEFINAIIEVDSNDSLYHAMRIEPIFLNNQIPHTFYPNMVCEKILQVYDKWKNRPLAFFYYGSAEKQVDVTNFATHLFIADDKILIPANALFNVLFGDVVPNVKKHLKIEILHNDAIVILPETRKNDFVTFVNAKIENKISKNE